MYADVSEEDSAYDFTVGMSSFCVCVIGFPSLFATDV